jgi:spore maturation protein CgeB
MEGHLLVRAVVVRPGPRFSVQDVCDGWVHGLRDLGVEVIDFNFDDRMEFYAHAEVAGRTVFNPHEAARLAAKGLEAVCYEAWPDVVLVVSGFFIPPDTYAVMRARGHKVVLLHTESPYEDDRQLPRAPHADLNVLNDPTNLERFQAAAPSVYLPHAYQPSLHHPRPADPEAASDFCFVGTGFPSRVEFFRQVDFSGIDVALAGNWHAAKDTPLEKFLAHDIDECCPNDQTARLYAAAKASANLYRKEATATADGWAMGPREVELAACGTFFLREPRPEGDELFPMLPTFTDPGEFEVKLRWWLAHDLERGQAAMRARAAVTDRTFTNHAARLLNLLGV